MHIRHRFISSFLCLWVCLFNTTVHAQSIRPASDRLDAIVSYPLIISIVTPNEKLLRKPVITKLDDGRVMTSEPFWVGVSPESANPEQSWTRPVGIWTATNFHAIASIPSNDRPLGVWFIQIDLPIDAVGQGLWFGDKRYELNWLPDPERTILEAPDAQSESLISAFWDLRLDLSALQDPAIIHAVKQYTQSPFTNWRSQLLLNGLNPHHNATQETGQLDSLELELQLNTPGSDLLKQIARQYKAKWQIILGRIWLIDPDVATRLKSALTLTARFDTRTLPLWNDDLASLDQLAQDLLSPFVDDQTRVLRAKAWLETQPRVLAWISDDQGTIDRSAMTSRPTVSVISLPQSPGVSLFRLDSLTKSANDAELVTLSPNTTTPIQTTIDLIPVVPTNPGLETAPLQVRTGRWSTTVNAIASLSPANAPYIRIGPLLSDWTMNALLTSRPLLDAATPPARLGVGLLRKTTPPSRDHPAEGWQLYFELASPDPSSPQESLTLWIGPYQYPWAVWTITPDGRVTLDSGSRFSIGLPAVQTRVLEDRWIVTIDLPEAAMDDPMNAPLLQLGIERTDATGQHTAWPRRMIPDQQEPGRLSIELNHYDGLGTSPQSTDRLGR
ncbi:MAG: hypothetical protein ACWA5W_08045 [Phycisphaerales bacterium]